MQNQERLKQQKLMLKSEVDDIESEIMEIRKRLSAQQKECHSVQKMITALETKLEQKKADKHSLLKACKVSLVAHSKQCHFCVQSYLITK